MKPIIHAKNLSKTFDDGASKVQVLRNVNLTIAPQETLAIVGASGSGKSSLLHLLGGLDKASSGDIFIHDQNISSLSEEALSQLRNQHLGFVYQFHHLLPEFTLLENVTLPLLIRGVNTRIAQEEAEEMLSCVGLSQRASHKIGEISGGERQRAAIARALVTKPSCLLADEPTGNLDKKNAAHVFDLLLSLNQNLGTSLVVVTHDLQLANALQKKYTLEEGQLKEI